MNIQERIEALETEFAERIKALKAEVQQEQEFPQYGDEYWYISQFGSILCEDWVGVPSEKRVLEVGNVYKTKEQAEFAVEKLKVEAELRKFSTPFKEGENRNWFILWNTYEQEVEIDWAAVLVRQGTIYFENKAKAQQAIESVGEERIKKYIFGVE